MQIRINKAYKGYSSKQGNKAAERLVIIAKCEQELENLVIPEVKTEIIGFAFDDSNGDYLGAIYNPDYQEAIEEVLTFYPDIDVSNLKHRTITKTI